MIPSHFTHIFTVSKSQNNHRYVISKVQIYQLRIHIIPSAPPIPFWEDLNTELFRCNAATSGPKFRKILIVPKL